MKRKLGALLGFVIVGVLLWWWRPIGPKALQPKPMATREPAEEVTRCVECHAAESAEFLKTGHALALRPAHDADVLARFAGKSVTIGNPPIRFRFWQENEGLWYRNEWSGLATQVHWMFGSGHHGMTPVAVARNVSGEDEGPDLHVSWYRGHGLALTMGHESLLSSDPHSLGGFNDAADTRRCFHCHTTELTTKGSGIETAHLLPGVLCSKCHTNARQHAERMNAVDDAAEFDDWKSLSPRQSVERCGECHRSPFVLMPEQLHPDNRQLTRFASIGLAMTQCFKQQHTRQQPNGQPRRLDCLTCHDPHRPAPRDRQVFNHQCRECHARPQADDSDCPNQTIASDCVSCHMPKVRMNAPVAFTDHWIRVRSPLPGDDSQSLPPRGQPPVK